ncbi:MAG: hypothetical protein E7487_03400, partial [Ruminococcaceae bacterium]|nr:hypothetical protein [Oscillospiraceae bacterium]
MKKQLLTLLIAFTLVLSGCQINSDANATDPQPDTQPSTLNTVSPTEPNGPKYLYDCIDFRFDNLDELDNFKAILEQGDDEKISEALSKLPGELDATKEDAARFLEIVQDIPYLDLIDGELGTIHYKKNFLAATGEPKEFIYVVFNASDGSWIRFEYLLSEEPPLTPDDVVSSDQNTIIFSNPMVIADGKVKIFS